jgi:hypothetical protein
MKKRLKTYYIGLIKASNSVKISVTKVGIAQFLGISDDTITRHMGKKFMYDTEEYIIWRRIPIEKVKRGWTHNQRVKW